MAVPSWKLPPLNGTLAGHYAVTVNANWRLTFRFLTNGDAELVDYQDYYQENTMSRMHNPAQPGEVLQD